MSGNWIGQQTFTGALVDAIDPTPDMIDIRDIAQGLANQCRFNGQIREFYSIAEHSIRVCWAVPDQALDALMHDSAEYLLGDLPAPLKHTAYGDAYREAESRLYAVIAQKYGLAEHKSPEIREADRRMLATERRELVTHVGTPEEAAHWAALDGVEPYPLEEPLRPLVPQVAAMVFLNLFHDHYKEA